MMHQVMAGALPFVAANPDQLYDKIMNTEVESDNLINLKIEPAAIALITGMLEKNPEKRITIEQALKGEWLNVSEDTLNIKLAAETLNIVGKLEKNITK